MESRINNKQGFALVTVLIVTMIGLLFGAGALLLWQYQCQMRIERQHELEKVYAVRSTLNYIRTYIGTKPIDRVFKYGTASGRSIDLLVKPVEAVFPNKTNEHHLAMKKTDKGEPFKDLYQDDIPFGYYNTVSDYDVGAFGTGVTNISLSQYAMTVAGVKNYGISFDNQAMTNANARVWVNIGMKNTGSWLKEEYGRRYWFSRQIATSFCVNNDIVRLCLVRDVLHSHDNKNQQLVKGFNRGWPLSQKNERALVFELTSSTNVQGKCDISFYEYERRNGIDLPPVKLISLVNCQPKSFMGMQLSKNNVSVFYLNTDGTGDDESHGYSFSSVTNLSAATYDYFTNKVEFSDGTFGNAIEYDGNGDIINTPDLRAVLEIQPRSRKDAGPDYAECLTRFRVTPAYQYDVSFINKVIINGSVNFLTNRATVAQRVGVYDANPENGIKSSNYSVRTYDTHGLEHKGFRVEEKEGYRYE